MKKIKGVFNGYDVAVNQPENFTEFVEQASLNSDLSEEEVLERIFKESNGWSLKRGWVSRFNAKVAEAVAEREGEVLSDLVGTAKGKSFATNAKYLDARKKLSNEEAQVIANYIPQPFFAPASKAKKAAPAINAAAKEMAKMLVELGADEGKIVAGLMQAGATELESLLLVGELQEAAKGE